MWKKKKIHHLFLHHLQDQNLRRSKHLPAATFHRRFSRRTRTARRVHHHSLRTHRQTASRITSFCRRSPRRFQIWRSQHHRMVTKGLPAQDRYQKEGIGPAQDCTTARAETWTHQAATVPCLRHSRQHRLQQLLPSRALLSAPAHDLTFRTQTPQPSSRPGLLHRHVHVHTNLTDALDRHQMLPRLSLDPSRLVLQYRQRRPAACYRTTPATSPWTKHFPTISIKVHPQGNPTLMSVVIVHTNGKQ